MFTETSEDSTSDWRLCLWLKNKGLKCKDIMASKFTLIIRCEHEESNEEVFYGIPFMCEASSREPEVKKSFDMLGPESHSKIEADHYKKNMIVKMFSHADGIQGSRVESIGMSG